MKSVLLSKLKNLVHGDDGAALVITLGVFFFMYIFCAGVYAIGFAVKERIQLQNACDAAAYSAAVVQADTISRIATINRAMAWTYAQMCRRQMDYIVYKWVNHTAEHYNEDLSMVRKHLEWRGNPLHGHIWWKFGPYGSEFGDYGVRLNESQNASVNGNIWESGIVDSCADFLSKHQFGSSFFAPNLPPAGTIRRLQRQIDFDKQTIRDMNTAIRTLASGMPKHIDEAVQAIAKANVPDYMFGQCRIRVHRSPDPLNDYMKPLNGEDEALFLSWAEESLDAFPWFPLDGGEGICRTYVQQGNVLKSKWKWSAYSWVCSNFGCAPSPVMTTCAHTYCNHSDNNNCDNCGTSVHTHEVVLRAEHLRDEYYDGERALPRKLLPNYFGRNGTITVGLMRKATSPWAPILGPITRGFYSAFNPYCDTYCFASAKAGYKLCSTQEAWELPRNGRTRAVNGDRDYCIDYKFTDPCRTDEIVTRIDRNGRLVPVMEFVEGIWRRKRVRRGTPWRHNWNLVQSDWDAVLLPVRQSLSAAEEERVCTLTDWRNGKYWYRFEPIWNNTSGRRLQEIRDPTALQKIVQNETWSDLDGTVSLADGQFGDMFAGGEHDPDPNGDWGENFLTKTSAGWNGWWDIPKTQADHSEKVQSRWNIGTPHGKLKWEEVSKLMFH